MPLAHGHILENRYRIEQLLGEGGYGAVYLAQDMRLQCRRAIKENLHTSLEARRQFVNEAKILASLDHANLPDVTDYFFNSSGQYLVMDFIEGLSLDKVLKQRGGPIPENHVIEWAAQICDALTYLHTRKPPVIHRDIKPSNIIITTEGKPFLVDFGIAKAFDPKDTTTFGAKALTRGYASPEQYAGKTEARSDIYSLGATLYHLLAGQAPPESILLMAEGKKSAIPAHQLNPRISLAVSAALSKAMEFNKEVRFANAEAFKDALSSKASPAHVELASPVKPGQPVGTVSPAPPLPIRPTPKNATATWLLIGLSVIAIFLVLLGGLAAWNLGLLNLSVTSTPSPVPSNKPVPTNTFAPLPTNLPTSTLTQIPTETSTFVSSPSLTPSMTSTDTLTPTPMPPSTPHGGGGQIAFVSERLDKPQIFIMNVDGSNVVQLTSLTDGACQPAWSPDGQQLLFITPCDRKRDLYPGASIYKMNADGTGQQLLIPAISSSFDPAWSVNNKIAFTSWGGGRPKLYVSNADGSNPQSFSSNFSADSQPAWSPDGNKLAFRNDTRSGDGYARIYWMFGDGSFDGSNPNEVSAALVEASDPDWSPDGQYVLYSGNSQLWRAKWEKFGNEVEFVASSNLSVDADWSPDGLWITFESWRDGVANHDVYIMTAAGGQITRLTDDLAKDYQPVWRPSKPACDTESANEC